MNGTSQYRVFLFRIVSLASDVRRRVLRQAWRFGLVLGLIGLTLRLIQMPAAADYLVHRGDVLQIDVAGGPALSRRATVDDKGKIYLPLIEGLSAVGLSLPELRRKVQDLLIAKNIFNPEVTVRIVEYQPVYVDGKVTHPGSYPYRPGLTVRNAVALADGNDIVQSPDVAALSAELISQAVRVARLQAALAGKTEIDIEHLPPVPVAPADLSGLVAVEAQQLEVEQDDYEKEKVHLNRMIETTRKQIVFLEQARQDEARQVDQFRNDTAHERDLLQKGLVQSSRLLEQQQTLSEAEFRLFDVMARAISANNDLETFSRRLQKISDDRRIKILQQLDIALGGLATTRARLAAEMLRYGVTLSPELRRRDEVGWQFLIFREADGNQQRITADKDTDLLPGDRVEVTATANGAPPVVGARPNERSH